MCFTAAPRQIHSSLFCNRLSEVPSNPRSGGCDIKAQISLTFGRLRVYSVWSRMPWRYRSRWGCRGERRCLAARSGNRAEFKATDEQTVKAIYSSAFLFLFPSLSLQLIAALASAPGDVFGRCADGALSYTMPAWRYWRVSTRRTLCFSKGSILWLFTTNGCSVKLAWALGVELSQGIVQGTPTTPCLNRPT